MPPNTSVPLGTANTAAIDDMLRDLGDWEHSLGPGREPGNPLSWLYAWQTDPAPGSEEHRHSPAEAMKHALYRIQFHQIYQPEAEGGLRRNWLQLWLWLSLATRRNISVMPALMYSVGPALLLELAGSEKQRQQARTVIAEGGQLCLALAEQASGTELLAIGTRAQALAESGEEAATGWQLFGSKGPLGWSERVRHALVLARTAAAGPESLSFFWVPLDKPSCQHCYGGAGLAGQAFAQLQFEGQILPADALVGEPGRGFELSLKTQLLVKFLSTAANVGGMHSLLRDVVDYARGPATGRDLCGYPHVRLLLARSLANLLTAEACALSAALLTGAERAQFSVAASACKQVALDCSQAMVTDLRDILSVDYALARQAIFRRVHKIESDLNMVRYMDTNPIINLKNILSQLLAVRAQWQNLKAPKGRQQLAYLLALFALPEAYFAERGSRIEVANAGGDWVINAAATLPEYLSQQAATADADTLATGQLLAASVGDFWRRFDALEPKGLADSAAAIELAKYYADLHAATSLTLLQLANPGLALPGKVLHALVALQIQPHRPEQADFEAAFNFLLQALDQGRALSLLPLTLYENSL